MLYFYIIWKFTKLKISSTFKYYSMSEQNKYLKYEHISNH